MEQLEINLEARESIFLWAETRPDRCIGHRIYSIFPRIDNEKLPGTPLYFYCSTESKVNRIVFFRRKNDTEPFISVGIEQTNLYSGDLLIIKNIIFDYGVL